METSNNRFYAIVDTYVLFARVCPVLIVIAPLATLIALSVNFSLNSLVANALLTTIAGYILSQYGRSKGKRCEAELFARWGGKPTTLLLQQRTDYIDKWTKERYVKKLQTMCPNVPANISQLELSDAPTADAAYNSFIAFLITRCRDKKKFNLVFRENINYGFWRNLWALKGELITVWLCSGLGYGLYLYQANKLFGQVEILFTAVCLLGAILFGFGLTADKVRQVGFAYGWRLLETLDAE